MQSDQINELAAALAKAQAAMQNAPMNRINPHFKSKYADLAAMRDAIIPPLSANGLSVTQIIEIERAPTGDMAMILRTMLMHISGQWLASEYPLPIGRPQEMGSAQTYARRYSLAALVCNSAEEDDDANAAQARAIDKDWAATKNNGKDAAVEMASITPEQVDEIQQLIVQTGTNIEIFCKYYKIAKVADLKAKDLEDARSVLNKKKKSP